MLRTLGYVLGPAVLERVGAYLEGYGFAPARRNDSAYLNAGITWLPCTTLQLDLRAGARADLGDERFFGVGFAWR